MHADQDINAHANPSRINDLTGLNPVTVWGVVSPRSVSEIQEALCQTRLPVSVGGGHFSMGGQTACPGGLHLDMRQMDGVLHFSPQAATLRVQAGIRWVEVLRFLDPHELAPAVMPRHANYTVGGSLAANAAGWGARGGPMIAAVHSLLLVLPNGECAEASAQRNSRLFYAALGGFGAVGVIAEVELRLVPNARLRAVRQSMPLADYADWRAQRLPAAAGAQLHEAWLALPQMRRVSALTWQETPRKVTQPARLQGAGNDARMARGVAWRNYVSSADLGAVRWQARGWVRVEQAFCVAADRLDAFVARLQAILAQHAVEPLSVHLGAVDADPGSLLAWTRGDHACVLTLAFRHPRELARREAVGVWMRESIEAVLAVGGCYLLGGQPHATPAQFMRAYPHAAELFAIKRELDPDNRLRNSLWDKYYQAWLHAAVEAPTQEAGGSVFHAIYDTVATRDAMYGHLLREGAGPAAAELHHAVRQACRQHGEDAAIYADVLQALRILPRAPAWRAWPRKRAAVRELAAQLRELVGARDHLTGWLELGTGGELLARLAGPLRVRGELIVAGETGPDYGLGAMLARGRRLPTCRALPVNDYAALPVEAVRDHSLDLVCCAGGLHGIPPAQRPAFLGSLFRVLRPGGLLLLREHDVTSDEAHALATLAGYVKGLLQGQSWEAQQAVVRDFASADDWALRLGAAGFVEHGVRLSTVGDPLRRVCMVFAKHGLSGGRA